MEVMGKYGKFPTLNKQYKRIKTVTFYAKLTNSPRLNAISKTAIRGGEIETNYRNVRLTIGVYAMVESNTSEKIMTMGIW